MVFNIEYPSLVWLLAKHIFAVVLQILWGHSSFPCVRHRFYQAQWVQFQAG